MTGTADSGDRGAVDDGGGDPVCWAHLLCPECGAVPDRPGEQRCPRCGAEFPAEDDETPS